MSAAEVAREAAQIITERGLAKGKPFGDDGSVCLWGALLVARGETELDDAFVESHEPIRAAIGTRLGTLHRTEYSRITGARYNDAPGTTAEDVAKLLLQVADDLDVQP